MRLLLILLFASIASISFSQDYFPLEIGNRWDYSSVGISHGPNYSYSNYSVIITDKLILPNNKEYYLFSKDIFEGYNLLRVENDSLYAFNSVDSSDCLILYFNKKQWDGYTTCLYKDVTTTELDSHKLFNYPDIQLSITGSNNDFEGNLYEFSSNWGIIYSNRWRPLYEENSSLKGCIISRITYGVLLDVEANHNMPGPFQLYQNYPNPFNPTTTISYSIPSESHITLSLYNTIGQLIRVLVDEIQNAGQHNFKLNAETLPSGIYFYKLNNGTTSQTKKLILLQ